MKHIWIYAGFIVASLVLLSSGCKQTVEPNEPSKEKPSPPQSVSRDTIFLSDGYEVEHGLLLTPEKLYYYWSDGYVNFNSTGITVSGGVVESEIFRTNGHNLSAPDVGACRWRGIKNDPPSEPSNGDMYKNGLTGKKYIYDSNTSQWIEW